MTQKELGIYIHVPFCGGKCPYCDFYSIQADETAMDAYTEEVISRMEAYASLPHPPADTLYFGGGTPSLLGGKRISALTKTARNVFSISDEAEITAEVNPSSELGGFFRAFKESGGNRISIGLQSASNHELTLLGRRHTKEQAEQAVKEAQAAGFENISLDLMIGIPGQTIESLKQSIRFAAGLGVPHVSAYLLKLEPRTAFYAKKESLLLPEEDAICAFYEEMCQTMNQYGFLQYEISNFAKAGKESRHNLKYWRGEEYLGFGPAAHSFYRGKRFYFPRELETYLNGCEPVKDGLGGSMEETAMLALRLAEGWREKDCVERFGVPIPESCRKAARRYEKVGLCACSEAGIRLTRKGFLLSNELIAEILLQL